MRLLLAGDFVPNDRVASLVEEERYYDIFPQDVVSLIKDVDYSILNLEAPVVKTAGACRITKSGPHLKTTEKAVKALEYAGFKAVTLANNHFRDYGDTGVADTVSCLKSENIDYVGGGMNISEASSTLYRKIGGYNLAFINCCEHEFSIATEKSAGANPLSPISQFRAIEEAKNTADFIIVIVHGGHEHYQLPSLRMQETYRFFIEAGADFVINHHQHCFSGYEQYNGKYIFYGLGNFCFDWKGKRNCIWNSGYMVELEFSREQPIGFRLLPYSQCDSEAKVKMLSASESSVFENKLTRLNETIGDRELLKKELDRYYSSTAINYLLALSPFSNKYIRALQKRKFFPSFITKKRIVQVKNLISCESHYDRFLNSLETELLK